MTKEELEQYNLETKRIHDKIKSINNYAKTLIPEILTQRGEKRGGYIVLYHENGLEIVSKIISKKKCHAGSVITTWDDMIGHVLNVHAFCHDYKDVKVRWVKTIKELNIPELNEQTCYSSRYSVEVRKLLNKMQGKE